MSEYTIDDDSNGEPPYDGSQEKKERWGFRKNKYAFFVVMFILMII